MVSLFSNFWMKNYGECIIGTSNCFVCGKDVHKVRDFHSIAFRGKEGKRVTPSVPCNGASKKNHFYELRERGEKLDDEDDVVK